MAHYYVEQLDDKTKKPTGYTIQFDKLSDDKILATVEIPKPSKGERYFGVRIDIEDLKDAYVWLKNEKDPSPEKS